MTAINSADVLALLEDGPKDQSQLLAWLTTSNRILRFAMLSLERDGHVKRVGGMLRWALASYAPPSRVPVPAIDAADGLRTLNENTLLGVLHQHGPQTIKDLAALLNVSPWTLRDRLAWWTVHGIVTMERDRPGGAYIVRPPASRTAAPTSDAPPEAAPRRTHRRWAKPSIPKRRAASQPRLEERLEEDHVAAAAAPVAPQVSYADTVDDAPAALPQSRRRVLRIGDEEFEVVWDGHGPLPDDRPMIKRGNSSLAGLHRLQTGKV